MHSVFFLSCASLLFIPGPTNILIFNSGYNNGFKKAPSLVLSEWSGYIMSITLWSVAAGFFFSTNAWMDVVSRFICSLYLFVLSLKLWFSGRTENAIKLSIDSKTIFCTTFLNPKAFIFATIIFPVKITDDIYSYYEAMIRFTIVLLTASVFWICSGNLLKNETNGHSVKIVIRYLSVLTLMSFSVYIFYQGVVKISWT
ncbi:LysE family translocator [Kosakonia sp. S42]|uniref:LysE family translocator n=1 Tax=Kosakonia sp. S42 TaxID=2767458 RepID=UPI00190D1199|nr:LysE family transporter [Kosakonia sp. S42]MBK0015668.1 LysE family transporter [Kosakonia sp. S42]